MPPLDALDGNSHVALDRFLEDNVSIAGNLTFNTSGIDLYGAFTEFRGSLPLLKASAGIVSLEPSVDGRLVSGNDSRIFIAYGSESLGLPEVAENRFVFGVCTLSFFEANNILPGSEGAISICDYEKAWPPNRAKQTGGDGCAEYMIKKNSSLVGNITYLFRNHTFVAPITGTENPLPQELQAFIEDSTGLERLDVLMEARMVFVYTVNDRHGTPCSNRLIDYTSEIPLLDNRSFIVEGKGALFFLHRPVLAEQWFRNNRFDMLVFSQNRIARADILLNGNITKSIDLLDFNISNDPYGLRHVFSINVSDNAPFIANTTPTPLQLENRSYGYVYMFNSTYGGLGKNNLTLKIYDFRNNSREHSEIIISRALSHSGKVSEEGMPVNETYTRKSREFGADELESVTLSFGLAGILVLILLMKNLKK